MLRFALEWNSDSICLGLYLYYVCLFHWNRRCRSLAFPFRLLHSLISLFGFPLFGIVSMSVPLEGSLVGCWHHFQDSPLSCSIHRRDRYTAIVQERIKEEKKGTGKVLCRFSL